MDYKKIIDKAEKIARDEGFSRDTKSYSVDEKNQMVQIREFIEDGREVTTFFQGGIINNSVMFTIKFLRAVAVYEFIGVDYVKELGSKKKEEKKVEGEEGTVCKTGTTKKTNSKKVGSGKGSKSIPKGKTADSEPVDTKPEGASIVGIGEGTPENIVKDVPKTTKVKVVKYDRLLKPHRLELANILNKVAPEWKTNVDVQTKAKAASAEMIGEAFITEDGAILETFIEKVTELCS